MCREKEVQRITKSLRNYVQTLTYHQATYFVNQDRGHGLALQEKKTTLFEAAEKGNEAMVKLLLENGAEVEEKGPFGQTALMRAAASGHEGKVKLLLEHGANILAKR